MTSADDHAEADMSVYEELLAKRGALAAEALAPLPADYLAPPSGTRAQPRGDGAGAADEGSEVGAELLA